ncbi:MAG: NADH-quinone oxidoreductase subunit [Alphaproteobacteria bacterium]|nr:NADH-quinone oxidoreductase subunit [Alphaproteobacteria bacterium]MDB5741297.1 NADH-quinone oxidoreductase subunit [Alphaproteobacteria bacterium]
MSFQTDLVVLLPEMILAIGAMALLLTGAIGGEKTASLINWGAIALLAISGAATVMGPDHAMAFHNAFVADGFSRFAKLLILCAAALSILLADEFFASIQLSRFELPVLMLIASLGMMLMVSSASFLSLYMGLELQSLALYVLAAFNRDHLRSTEAGLKYFVLGALSSGMMLYGISLIYGFTGTTEFAAIAAVTHGGAGLGVIFGIVFLIAGLAFKVSAVPFHMWTPDVYEGAPTPITAYFATAAKVAALCLFLRAILTPFPDLIHQWRQIIIFISVLSMALGAIAAIGQTNIKRLMAYSSIGHMGYALLGLAAGSSLGVRGVLIYLAIYVFTNLGVFAAIQAMQRGGKAVESISDLAGLARTDMKLAVVFSMLFLSLAGLPPLAGFFAKFYVFLAAMQAGLVWPAVIGVLTSAIGLVYYLRLVKVMFFDEPAPSFDIVTGFGSKAILALSAAVALLFIFAASPIITAADAAARSLLP